jgi:hypothetical protein
VLVARLQFCDEPMLTSFVWQALNSLLERPSALSPLPSAVSERQQSSYEPKPKASGVLLNDSFRRLIY